MAQQYDSATKFLAHEYPQAFAQFVFGLSDITILERLDTEQPTIKTHRNDSTLKVRLPDKTAILHAEVQAHDSQKPMWSRIAGYQGFLISEHQLPVYSCVLYLHPRAGMNDSGYYAYEEFGCKYVIQYKVIRLIDIEGQPILESQTPGLLPLTPLMKPPAGMDAERWLETCVDATASANVDTESRNLLLEALGIFGGLVYDALLIRQKLSEGIMRESSIIQHYMNEAMAQGIEQGIEQGEKKATVDSILDFLTTRYPAENVLSLRPKLEKIEDLKRLKQLRLTAYDIETFEDFYKYYLIRVFLA